MFTSEPTKRVTFKFSQAFKKYLKGNVG
jgi:hypothetical protein